MLSCFRSIYLLHLASPISSARRSFTAVFTVSRSATTAFHIAMLTCSAIKYAICSFSPWKPEKPSSCAGTPQPSTDTDNTGRFVGRTQSWSAVYSGGVEVCVLLWCGFSRVGGRCKNRQDEHVLTAAHWRRHPLPFLAGIKNVRSVELLFSILNITFFRIL